MHISKRDLRNARRTNLRESNPDIAPTPSPSSSSSPFVQLMASKFDDSSDDDSSHPSQVSANLLPTQSAAGVEESKDNHEPPTPTIMNNDDTPSVHSDLTKHAEALENEMDSAMAELHDPELVHDGDDTNKLETVIKQTVQTHIRSITTRLLDTETRLADITQKYESLVLKHDETIQQLTHLQSNYDRINRQVNFVSRSVDTAEPRISTLERSIKDLSNTFDAKLKAHFESHLHDIRDAQFSSQQHDPNHSPLVQTIVSKQEKLQRRLNRLKNGTKDMFHQTESDYDLLTDRIHRLETDLNHMKNNTRTAQKKLSYPQSSDSDSSSFATPKHHKQSPKFESHKTPEDRYQHTNYYRGPNMDYLRKNVNITCSTQDQILEFYIKLRLAIEKGGIHIIPIEQITKDKSIAHQMNHMTATDLHTQSNALFTILSNENFIPKDFTMAQNCILGYASTMDGFGALKAMLKLTHPLLSRKRPTNVPPVLSDSTDIHSYEQSLRNYYLLHKLYNDTDYPPIEKAKQFLQGVDDDRYSDAVARVQHQLDTAETLNSTLHEDYDIDNIASTLINITGEYDNTRAIVNTMRKDYNPNSSPDKC